MDRISHSPLDPAFVADPYAFYDRARALGPVVWWDDYAMPALTTHAAVLAALRDRRLGRVPPGGLPAFPPGTAHFARLERLSLLSLEGDTHARLRGHVLRAFTGRRVVGLTPDIASLCNGLIDRFPGGPFDLVTAYAEQVPIVVIARLMGVPESAGADLRAWSQAMVAMYRPGIGPDEHAAADAAARDFAAWLGAVMDDRRARPGTDLLSALNAAEDAGAISRDESLATCVLLLNAGHEATVHALGNAVVRILREGDGPARATQDRIAATVDECLRIDPPLHLFTRYALEPVTIAGHTLAPGDEIACLLGAANRDPAAYDAPEVFRPDRPGPMSASFGAGVHFCLGAQLARLEMQVALTTLFARCPDLALAEPPAIAPIYHFHGHARIMART
jgi:cytochrome P450